MCYAIGLIIAVLLGLFVVWSLCAIAARMDDLQGTR
jgi:hypothetical protein